MNNNLLILTLSLVFSWFALMAVAFFPLLQKVLVTSFIARSI